MYDGLGRTLQVQQPNSAGTTQYAYAGNAVTVTDPAGKWKKYTSDAFGNLVQVTEPNPAGGANYETYYSYNLRNKLTQVQMPRPVSGGGTVTQYRTFVYDTLYGVMLQSQSHPESGTTTFGYHGDGALAWKQDAKGQRVEYAYDAYGRVATITPKNSGGTVQTCDVYNYVYDQSSNTYGRLAYIEWGNSNTATCAKGLHRETFAYTSMGKVISKNFTLTQNALSASLLMQYGYNSLGMLSQVTYPATVTGAGVAVPGRIYNYTYDAMNRPVGETEQLNGGAPQLTLVDNVQYGTADVIQQMRWYPTAGGSASFTENRTYDSLYQLTSIRTKNQANADQMYVEYRFPAANNDGRITSMKDYVTGEEVQYQYDALQRLSTANLSMNILLRKIVPLASAILFMFASLADGKTLSGEAAGVLRFASMGGLTIFSLYTLYLLSHGRLSSAYGRQLGTSLRGVSSTRPYVVGIHLLVLLFSSIGTVVAYHRLPDGWLRSVFGF